MVEAVGKHIPILVFLIFLPLSFQTLLIRLINSIPVLLSLHPFLLLLLPLVLYRIAYLFTNLFFDLFGLVIQIWMVLAD